MESSNHGILLCLFCLLTISLFFFSNVGANETHPCMNFTGDVCNPDQSVIIEFKSVRDLETCIERCRTTYKGLCTYYDFDGYNHNNWCTLIKGPVDPFKWYCDDINGPVRPSLAECTASMDP